MAGGNSVRIAVLPGDGIGTEVTTATLAVLETLGRRHGLGLATETLPAGAFHFQATGEAFPESSFAAAAAADAILLGAMGWPGIRQADGTEIAPQLDLRFRLNLYAGVRPVRAIPGVPLALADPRARDIDFVLIRESTEGLFHSRGRGLVTADLAEETLRITRAVTEKLSRFAFRLAERRAAARAQRPPGPHPARAGSPQDSGAPDDRSAAGREGLNRPPDTRPARVTLIDKANVFRAFAFMRAVFDGIATEFPHVEAAHHYVDAMALDLIRRPWEFDVLPTENMFGDILSDLAAGLVGGMGFSPSADIGDDHAVFQPAHGTAPDIAGQGVANPTAMLLSAAMMLDWLAERGAGQRYAEAGAELARAVDASFAAGLRTRDIGGRDDTAAVVRAIIGRLG